MTPALHAILTWGVLAFQLSVTAYMLTVIYRIKRRRRELEAIAAETRAKMMETFHQAMHHAQAALASAELMREAVPDACPRCGLEFRPRTPPLDA